MRTYRSKVDAWRAIFIVVLPAVLVLNVELRQLEKPVIAAARLPGIILALSLAFQRGHADLVAQRRLRDVDRRLTVEILIFAVKDRVLLDAEEHIEIAGRSAG